MSYHLNEEQKMIQAMVRDLAREFITPTAAERDRTREFPADIIKKMGELGLMGMNVPPDYGGAGVDTISYITRRRAFKLLQNDYRIVDLQFERDCEDIRNRALQVL